MDTKETNIIQHRQPGIVESLPYNYEFHSPVKICSGKKAMEHIPFELAAMNATRPLVLASDSLIGRRAIKLLTNAFKESEMPFYVCDDVPDHADAETVRRLTTLYLEKNHDAIIVAGDGPAVDIAKVIRLMVAEKTDDLEQFEGEIKLTRAPAPLIILQTFDGSGLEASGWATVCNQTFFSAQLAPQICVIDPRMIIPMDIKTTWARAMVSLTQAVEVYMAADRNPVAINFAFTAIQSIRKNLAPVFSKWVPHKKRLALANAYTAAACTFSNNQPGPAFLLGKATAQIGHLNLGTAMGIILPYAMTQYMRKTNCDLADLLRPLSSDDDYAGTTSSLRGKKAIRCLYDLQWTWHQAGRRKIPLTLKDAAVGRYLFPDIIETALKNGLPVFDETDCETVLEHAWEAKPLNVTS